MTSATRHQTVKAAFDEYFNHPDPIPGKPIKAGSNIELVGEVITRLHQHGEVKPGGTTAALAQLAPDERQRVVEVANLYHEHKEFGRHGRPQDVLKAFGVSRATADAVEAGLTVDYVANELQRRRGNDADRPLPEITRRDILSAAFDANQE